MALEVRTRQDFPREWAATQNNLGFALQELGAREGNLARLEAAVEAYKMALEVRHARRFSERMGSDPEQSGLRASGTGEARG